MRRTKIFTVLLIFILREVRSQSDTYGKTDYCNLFDCGTKHVACKGPSIHPSVCPREAKLIDLDNQREFIVSLHNFNRNRVAGGVSGLRRAARMATMSWDRDLAYVAKQTVLHCQTQTDLCHNTPKFQHSGQNAVTHGTRKKTLQKSLQELIKMDIELWFNQSSVATRAIVKKYRNSSDRRIYGHFTLVANERNTHVGCAAIEFRDNGYLKLIFLCNYATNNIRGKAVFKTCNVIGCKCRTGMNVMYPNLCSLRETYDYNYSS